ncbi:MAG TPA: hypothetical protein VNM22_21400 [Candidatus Limnocylindrales bacterium]|nr:hypothetical protein [Candidatus Limnocylindrales bacterium]
MQKKLFSWVKIVLLAYLVFLGYGTFCLVDHELDFKPGISLTSSRLEPSQPSPSNSRDQHPESSHHICVFLLNLISGSLTSQVNLLSKIQEFPLDTFIRIESLHLFFDLSFKSRAPPLLHSYR